MKTQHYSLFFILIYCFLDLYSCQDPCTDYAMLIDNTRYIDSNLPTGVDSGCDRYIEEGWYRFDGDRNMPTSAPNPGQCYTYAPIWIDGTYPQEGETAHMKACKVGFTNTCDSNWSIYVKNCGLFNVFQLSAFASCEGRYCMDSVECENGPCTNYNASCEYSFTRGSFLCSCLPKFTGSLCETDLNACSSGPCQNNGTCSTDNDDFICTCQTGFTGTLCEINLNQCLSAPCNNNASCTNADGSFYCTCLTGYTGSLCDTDIDECLSNPCMNNGSCIDTEGSYMCQCSPGWTGYSCEQDIDECLSNPCMNNGSCIDTEGSYTCQCSPGWTGYSCDHDIDECLSNPCMNNGSCIDTEGSYTCQCSPGWTGYSCEQDIDECLSNPCMNNGSCIDTEGSYTCQCSPGWTGYSCEQDIDECLSNPCKNNGSCIDTEGSYTCQCSSGWTGYSCEQDLDECTGEPCQNKATCNNTIGSFICTCLAGYTGLLCDMDIDECSSVPCQNNASCSNNNGSFSCSCLPGFTDALCESDLVEDENITLDGYIYITQSSFIPTFDPYSPDRMLMFRCDVSRSWQELNFNLNELIYDVRWDIDDEEIVVKRGLNYTEIYTDGVIRSTEWINAGKKMGFNINCAIRGRLHANSPSSPYVKSWSSFVGIEVYPQTSSISSGQSAQVWLYPTVPIACIFNTNVPCKLRIELFDFTEQFSPGTTMYCNESILELTKPSLCGLEIDGWQTWFSHPMNITVPANAEQDQEYTAVVKLRSSGLSYDPLWEDYHLAPITIKVLNENLTEGYWNWQYAWCSSGSDPWFWTFDNRDYGFHDEGEFVLFRHKTKPIEVHTIQRKFNTNDSWTENCAIAVRAASDVFFVYGCGTPQNWIIRRLNCDAETAYLQVYYRWNSYEIHLPTGTIVTAYKSRNRRLNVSVILSRSDREDVEGLCGNWNDKYGDDFTDRYGNILDNSTEFARTWSVQANESLFIKKTRDETLSLSYMYCTCLGEVRGQLSPDVDCSWQENIPVCPPIHWTSEPCKVRKRRAVDDDDDDEIDVSEDIVNHKEHPELSEDWKNGWNESSAQAECMSKFQESPVYESCTSLANVNVTAALTTCIANIRMSGTTDFISDSLEGLISQCSVEVRLNSTLSSAMTNNGSSIYDTIVNSMCPNDCKYDGVKTGDCDNGYCTCNVDYTGDDCSISVNKPPTVAGLSQESACDTSNRGCNSISIYGSGYYSGSGLTCRIRNGEIIGSSVVPEGTYATTSAEYKNTGEVKCSLISTKRRRKRSTISTSTTTVYLLSVTNNGVNFSDEVPVIIYNADCTECTITNSVILCQYRNDVCVTGNVCYASNSTFCQPTDSTEQKDSDQKTWLIVGVISGSLLLILIVVLLVKCHGNDRMTIFPLCSCSSDSTNRHEDGLFYRRNNSVLTLKNGPPISTRMVYHEDEYIT